MQFVICTVCLKGVINKSIRKGYQDGTIHVSIQKFFPVQVDTLRKLGWYQDGTLQYVLTLITSFWRICITNSIIPSTSEHKTSFDSINVYKTSVDSTNVYKTSFDSTNVHKTRFEGTNVDKTNFDSTNVYKTSLDTTNVHKTR